MKKAWKIVLMIALAFVVIGAVAGVAGWLTGASTDRMIDVVFGSRDALDMIIQVLKQELSSIF